MNARFVLKSIRNPADNDLFTFESSFPLKNCSQTLGQLLGTVTEIRFAALESHESVRARQSNKNVQLIKLAYRYFLH